MADYLFAVLVGGAAAAAIILILLILFTGIANECWKGKHHDKWLGIMCVVTFFFSSLYFMTFYTQVLEDSAITESYIVFLVYIGISFIISIVFLFRGLRLVVFGLVFFMSVSVFNPLADRAADALTSTYTMQQTIAFVTVAVISGILTGILRWVIKKNPNWKAHFTVAILSVVNSVICVLAVRVFIQISYKNIDFKDYFWSDKDEMYYPMAIGAAAVHYGLYLLLFYTVGARKNETSSESMEMEPMVQESDDM